MVLQFGLWISDRIFSSGNSRWQNDSETETDYIDSQL